MSDALLTVVLLGAGTYALKAAGPLVLGNRVLPVWLTRISALAPAALLAGLVAVSTFAEDGALVADARIAGLGTAAVALRLRAPFLVVVVAAAAATALVRAI